MYETLTTERENYIILFKGSHCVIVFKGSTLHNLSDKWHLLGRTHSKAAAATGRTEAYETFKIFSGND